MRFIYTLSLLSALLLPLKGIAQDDAPLRPVAAAYTLEAGSAHIADTYLTPLRYSGQSLTFAYERSQAMKFDPERWIMSMRLEVGGEHTQNPVKNATIWGAGLTYRWGMLRRVAPALPVKFAIGGSTGVNIGALYTSRNGNNPVAAKASWTINLTASASYATKVIGIPVTLSYRPTLPITGIFFSQGYGELYYEIYLGNRKGLVHGAWPGNYLYLDNLFTADFGLGATKLRMGYHNTILSTHVNNLTTRMTTHSFVLGISGEWLSYSPNKKISDSARVISATY